MGDVWAWELNVVGPHSVMASHFAGAVRLCQAPKSPQMSYVTLSSAVGCPPYHLKRATFVNCGPTVLAGHSHADGADRPHDPITSA